MPIVNTISRDQYIDVMLESELQQYVERLALAYGWLYFHDTDSRKNARGFPDTVLVKPPYIVYAELKTARGRLRTDQIIWLNNLHACRHIVYLWRPCDLSEIHDVLSGTMIPQSNYTPR